MIFEISPHPLPLPSGERGRVRGGKMLEENSQIFSVRI
jgi:hypothetical protein